LELLEGSAQITSRARRWTLEFVEAVEAEFGVELGEHNASMLVTHLAIALTRSERGTPLAESAPAGLVAEVDARERERAFVKERLDAAGQELGVLLPSSEYVFVAAHLCTITEPT
jgi:hypothetical protein